MQITSSHARETIQLRGKHENELFMDTRVEDALRKKDLGFYTISLGLSSVLLDLDLLREVFLLEFPRLRLLRLRLDLDLRDAASSSIRA